MASIFMKSLVGLNLVGLIFCVFLFLRISNFVNAPSIRGYSTGGENPADIKRANVVIVSQGRGGSTFLGELFNSNPEVFYIFEPLHLLGSLLGLNVFYEQETQEYGRTSLAVLRSFLACDFSNQTKVLDALSAQQGLRSKSNVLSKNELCSEKFKKLEKARKRKHCQRISTINANRVCKEKKHTVIKVLVNRLPNKTMASLKELLEGNYDMKILHLVRDPRPVVYSWVKNAWIEGTEDPKLVDNVHRICNPIYENVLLGESLPGWLQGRYKLVLYEELAVDPLKMAREIYDFVGFPWAPEVEKWIYLTRVAAAQRAGSPKNPYSTIRNGSVEVTRWVSEAPRNLVRIVEEVCGNLMAKVGYKQVTRWGDT